MSFQNIIVRMPNWVGDLVMATPVLLDLRKHFPKASITAMCKHPMDELLWKEPALDELFCFHEMSSSFARREERRSVIAKLRAGHYDLGILLTNSFSSAWLFWQGNIPTRIGFSLHFRRWLLSHPQSVPKEMLHQVDVYKKLLEPLGISHSSTSMRLVLTDQEKQIAQELLRQRGYRKERPLIGINPGAAYGTAKCWLPDRFRALALKLIEAGYFVLFFGDAGGAFWIRDLCQGLPSEVLNLAGATTLRELAALIQECDVLVTNDSGPMHMAAALQTAVVALFGSTDPRRTGPLGEKVEVIQKQVPCSPCFKRTCPIDFPCMKQISVEEVFKRVRTCLER